MFDLGDRRVFDELERRNAMSAAQAARLNKRAMNLIDNATRDAVKNSEAGGRAFFVEQQEIMKTKCRLGASIPSAPNHGRLAGCGAEGK